jgi:hypothetical protein
MKKSTKIYKKFIILIFKIIYGEIKINNKKKKINFNKKKITYKNEVYDIYEINNCRIYTNTNDVAYIKDNIIIPGPSLQLRKNLNQNVKYNHVINNGTPKYCKNINNRVFSLLCGVDANNNYFHWFFDCLPRYFFYKKFYKFNKDDFFIVPNLMYNYQKESLKILKIKNIINAYDQKHFKMSKLITMNFNNTINHPHWVINDLKKAFKINKFNLNKKKTKLFITREGINSLARDVENKKELIKFLKNKNFLVINPSKLTFLEEIKLFNSAKIIISLYGAALTNIIFCKNNANVIELRNNFTDDLYKNITKKAKLNYYSITSKRIKSNNVKRNFDGSVNVSIRKISNILTKIY